jgi:hypothetical protein
VTCEISYRESAGLLNPDANSLYVLVLQPCRFYSLAATVISLPAVWYFAAAACAAPRCLKTLPKDAFALFVGDNVDVRFLDKSLFSPA